MTRSLLLATTLIALGSAAAGCGKTIVRDQAASTHDVVIDVQQNGDLQVEERIALTGDLKKTRFTRNISVAEAKGAWPLWQTVHSIRVETNDGEPLPHEIRRYQEHVNIDLLQPNETVVIGYVMTRGANLSKSMGRIDYEALGLAWNATTNSIRIELRTAAPHTFKRAGLSYTVGYGGKATYPELEETEDGVRWKILGPIKADEPVQVAIEFNREKMRGQSASFHDIRTMGGLTLLVLFGCFAGGFILLVLPSKLAIMGTRLLVLFPVIAVGLVAWRATAYWLGERTYRPVGDNLAGEAAINFALVAFVASYAIAQNLGLKRRVRASYFTQFAWPAALIICWPLSFVDRQMLFFPLIGAAIYLFWWRRSIALSFGVGLRRIVEFVTSRGECSVAEVAKQFRLPENRLHALLSPPPSGVVIDRKSKKLFSAEAFALREEYALCSNCGGATTTQGMAEVKCDFCGHQYASAQELKKEQPVPVVIESTAAFFGTLGMVIGVLAFSLALAIFIMELTGGSFVGGLIGAAIGGIIVAIPAVICAGVSQNLRKGKSLGVVKFLLVITLPLLVPIVVLFKLRSRRVRIFFGQIKAQDLQTELETRGEWPLSEFAAYLQTNAEDAQELASYITHAGLVDGVFEISRNRLVHRQLYRDRAAKYSCQQCGGFFGIIGGKVSCHFCGEGPAENQNRPAPEG